MKRALTLGLGLLLAGAMSVAQTTTPGTSSDQSQTGSNSQTTVQGCLRGSDGNWMLTDSSGTTWKLMGSTDQLKDHNGHTITVTGSTSGASSSASSTTSPDNTNAAPTTSSNSSSNQQTLNMTSFKHIADTCSSSSSSNMPQSDTSAAASSTTATSSTPDTGNATASSTMPQSSQTPDNSATAQSSTSSTAGSTTPAAPETQSNAQSATGTQSSTSSSSTASPAPTLPNNQPAPPEGQQQAGAATSSTTQANSTQTQAGTGSTLPQSGAGAGNGIRGCLLSSNSNFTLRADDGRMLQLQGDSAKLSGFANQEVEVIGNTGTSETSSNSAGQSVLNVTDVRKIADSCQPGSASALPQSADTTDTTTAAPKSDTDKDATVASNSALPQSDNGQKPADQNAAASANATDTGTAQSGSNLPQTASPLPLLGLLGFGSLVAGVAARFKR